MKARRILVVDDVQLNREVLGFMLDFLGLPAVMVESGEHALQCLQDERFALVLMDWHMPAIDGLEVTRRLRVLEATSARPRTPLVIVSASAIDHQVAQCLAAGADDHLAKPFRLPDLERLLQRWMPAGTRLPAS